MNQQSECPVCGGARWVCEDHADKPWGEASTRADACHCGGAGAPCLACNPSDRKHPPKMPKGYKTILEQGWLEALTSTDTAGQFAVYLDSYFHFPHNTLRSCNPR
jgi:hypothetical protein